MQNQDDKANTTPVQPEDQVLVNEETTQDPVPAQSQAETLLPKPVAKKKGLGRKIGLGTLAFIIIVVLGGVLGYAIAISDRVQHEQAVIKTAIYDQFLLGIVNMERGEYEIARQRFEYVLQLEPNHTEAVNLLTQALLHLGESSEIPTPRPSATPAPTADMRNQLEIFNSALALRNAADWDSLINTLDALRTSDPSFKSVEVDGLYYIAYRNRGLQRIRQEGNLEGGIFDITRAEAFGPLDVEATNYRKWAEDYQTGVSFWGIDWSQVLSYFNQLAVSAPYLRDSSFLTSLDRLATAQVELYAQYLVTAGYRMNQGKYCEAYDLYNEASIYIVLSADAQLSFENARDRCLGIPPTEAPQETTTP